MAPYLKKGRRPEIEEFVLAFEGERPAPTPEDLFAQITAIPGVRIERKEHDDA